MFIQCLNKHLQENKSITFGDNIFVFLHELKQIVHIMI
jgi:hypothetical protein